jgi:acetyl-CoA carboxylase biotin carboxylase subunit
MSRSLKKILIANRGEIAVRIAQTLRALQIESVAVYSTADRSSPHVQACDHAVCIGPGPAAQSYLQAEKLIAVALAAGCDAVHPGYGFLSENADFAEAVAAAGMVFIGPPAAAIRLMGNKTRARQAMQEACVPCVPGSEGDLPGGTAGEAAAAALAQKFGYPVMLKAAAGGGGKGMRLVHSHAQLGKMLRAAASEAQNAFGDASVYLEKAIVAPRHVEIQIFSDAQGQTYFLGERECSMQRRHQKVLEECPSPMLDPELRRRMGEVACRAAQAVQYRGAGTVEFLVDAEKKFYFLEMNTRLQVEHAVTEAVYGLDLVAAQVQVAQGESLPWTQASCQPRGHAIEARIYAEDPSRNFLPCPGFLKSLTLPHGPGIRVDCGVAPYSEVPRYYDPMMAKIICWGETREQARQRLLGALQQTHFAGITDNCEFLVELVRSESFASGDYTTGTIDSLQAAKKTNPNAPQAAEEDVWAIAAAIAALRRDTDLAQAKAAQVALQQGAQRQLWRAADAPKRGF